MKKLMIACLACVLAVVLVVPAFAASAIRIGITSYYYTPYYGFGGGDHGNGKAYVPSSVLSSYLVDAKSAYSSYYYELAPCGGDMCIGVYSSSNGKLGYLSTSDGLIYASQVEYYIDTGGTSTSSIDYSSVLSSILSAVNTVADNVTSVYSALTYSTGQRVYTVANLLYSSQLNLSHIEEKLTATNGYIDGLESKIDTSNTRLNTLNTTTSNGFSDVFDKIDILTDEVYTGNSNLNTIDSHVDGLESSIVVTNNRISAVDTDLNIFYASTSAGFTDVLNNFSRVSGQLVDIQNLLSGLNNSPVVSTTNSPYVRKIYNVLFDGVDGTGTDMVDIATSQMGVSVGRPYYTWYGFNSHVEWCAVFVSWCADQCGYLDDIIPKFAVVDDGADWFKVRSLWFDGGGTPSPGDIIFFDMDVDHDPDHVGIVADCVDGIVTTVEGNTGDSPGVVSSRSITVDSPLIYGYGTPDYPAGGSSIYSVLVGISNKIGETVNYDTDIDIPIDDDTYNVFYVDDGDDDKSIVDLSKDSVKVFGKLLNFLYKVMIKDALSDGGGVGALSDFYLGNDEEVIDLWAS